MRDDCFNRNFKKTLLQILVLFFALSINRAEAICVNAPPKNPPVNIIEGWIDLKNINDLSPGSYTDIKIWIDGKQHFTTANREGYFCLTNIKQNKIRLRFQRKGKSYFLDLGNVGWGKIIRIKGINLQSRIKYTNISIEPYMDLKNDNIGTDLKELSSVSIKKCK